jgi:putative transposase
MQFDPKIHHRHSIRLKRYDYTTVGAYFITVITFHRENLFGVIRGDEVILSAMGKITDENWSAIPEHFPRAELGAYAIMPNHVHGIIILNDDRKGTNDGRGTIYRAPTQPGRAIC